MMDDSATIPARTRRLVSIRAGGCCEVCGRRDALVFHRLTTDKIGHERPDDVLAVCTSCRETCDTDPPAEVWEDADEIHNHFDAYHNTMGNED